MPDLKFVRRISILIVFSAAIAATVNAQPSIALQDVVTSGLTSPVFVTSSHDGTGRLFIVQQNGIIRVFTPGSGNAPTDYLNIASRVTSGGERGLLGLAFHPGFRTNRRFFVYYTRAADGAIQIAEYQQSTGNINVADTAESIIITIPHPVGNHNGGTVAFGSDGYLYAGPGDGGGGDDPDNNAQNINVLLGKIIRLDIDNVPVGQVPAYNIPPTNPYAGATPGRDEIYAIGLRNPYRFSFDTKTAGARGNSAGPWPLWVADVGQNAIEEIDIVTLGGNYGWRVYEGTNCNTAISGNCPTTLSQTPPIFQYSHAFGCSITGGFVYRGRAQTLPNGSYIYADYCNGRIFLYNGEAIGTAPVQLLDTNVNIVGFGKDDRGEIYVIGAGGTIQKIVRASGGRAEGGRLLRKAHRQQGWNR